MDLLEIAKQRHSVRSYIEKEVENNYRVQLNEAVKTANEEGKLNFQVVYDEKEAFSSFLAHCGKFSGVSNYIAIVAKKGMEVEVGYYGERIVLLLQSMGLNSCWVGLTYKKVHGAFKINKGEKLYCVIAFGYGKVSGASHKVKSIDQVSGTGNKPEWFKQALEAALLAPTATNQQKFKIDLEKDDVVKAKHGAGLYTKLDLGIVKYHFELGAKGHKFSWVSK